MKHNSPDEIELECCRYANSTKRKYIEKELNEFNILNVPFENPAEGISLKEVEWNENIFKRVLQIIFLPLVLLLTYLIAVPFMYILHLLNTWIERRELKKRLYKYTMDISSMQLPKCKTIFELWNFLDLDYSDNHDALKNILNEWLIIIYGKEISQNVEIESRLKEIAESHGKANKDYYDGVPGAPHFTFASPLETLIRNLSDELPNYR